MYLRLLFVTLSRPSYELDIFCFPVEGLKVVEIGEVSLAKLA